MELSKETIKTLENFSKINNELIIERLHTNVWSQSYLRDVAMKDKIELPFDKEVRFSDLKTFLKSYKALKRVNLIIEDDQLILDLEGDSNRAASKVYFFMPNATNLKEWEGLCTWSPSGNRQKKRYASSVELLPRNTFDAVTMTKDALSRIKKSIVSLKLKDFGLFNGVAHENNKRFKLFDERRDNNHSFSSLVESTEAFVEQQFSYKVWHSSKFIKSLPLDDYIVSFGEVFYDIGIINEESVGKVMKYKSVKCDFECYVALDIKSNLPRKIGSYV